MKCSVQWEPGKPGFYNPCESNQTDLCDANRNVPGSVFWTFGQPGRKSEFWLQQIGLQILGKPNPEEWELCDAKGINLSAQMQRRGKKDLLDWFSSPMHLFWIIFFFFPGIIRFVPSPVSSGMIQLQTGTMRSASSDYFHLVFILHSLPSHN